MGPGRRMPFVLLSCAVLPGCAFANWLMGYTGDRVGLGQAFYLVPACFLCLAVLIGCDWRQARLPRSRPVARDPGGERG